MTKPVCDRKVWEHMKYSDSAEKSAEYLRLALPLMAKQDAAMHPVSYAVWYDYVAGRNAALTACLDEHLKADRVLDEKATYEFYQKHVAEFNEEQARQIGAGFQQVMADVSASAAQAGDEAGRFGDALGKWGDAAAASTADRGQGIATVLGLTRHMQGSIVALKASLDDSQQEIEQLRRDVIKARAEALTDGLTGLTNRRGFEMAIGDCLAHRENRDDGPSLLIADIDHFKKVNDSYGHLFGDKVLKAVAQILQDNVKGKDTAARFGGEEFVVLLPDTPPDGARRLAENIRAIVERCRIKRAADNGAVANITISIGIAGFRLGEAAHDLVARADAALYAAKSGGRNRVGASAA
jgi:diguanylate cyclase